MLTFASGGNLGREPSLVNDRNRPVPVILADSLNGNYAAKTVIPLSVRSSDDPRTAMESRAAITWAQRLKRVVNIDIEMCSECGSAVVAATLAEAAEYRLA